MDRKDRIDAFGAVSLTGFSLLLAVNQVVIKLVNEGLQPVFFAGLRSAIALACLWVWLVWRGRRPRLSRDIAGPGIAIGLFFSGEFVLLFLALDLTTVTRTSVILYSMPLWLALGAHVLIPGERITPIRALGLVLAFAGVAWAFMNRGAGVGEASLLGDLCALGAASGWTGIALCARTTRLREVRAETQLLWQLAVSVPVLMVLAPFFGPLIRDFQPVHLAGLAFQSVVVVAAGFLFWLWLLSVYPASGVAGFSFLTPIFGVTLGWFLLGETVGPGLVASAALVAVGIVLINRPRRKVAAPPPP